MGQPQNDKPQTAKTPKAKKTAIRIPRDQNFANWYQEVIKEADLAENSGVRGCMVIKPWGYGLWEQLQSRLDQRIKETGHDNCYFPLFIPLELIEKEAAHVEGFAKEMAVVTHHRLVSKDGKLVPDGKLESPLVVRPTSETMIGESFAKWIVSYRDLPVKINQWANVVRWEMRTRLFLRTSEFLWQEGHTAHATAVEAADETMTMIEVYRELAEDWLAIPVITGEKSANERFPGAINTFTIEAMMQDGKALQAGTSHNLGQNFAHAANIKFQDKDGGESFAHTTSWGVSTRMIGGIIMTHSDDDGLRVPPKVAPRQVVIIPIVRKEEDHDAVMSACDELAKNLMAQDAFRQPVRVTVDKREVNPGEKRWGWIKKGAPIICEIGPRDIENAGTMVTKRTDIYGKAPMAQADLVANITTELTDIQDTLFEQAKAYRDERTRDDITTFEDFAAYFGKKGSEGEGMGDTGFVKAWWCEEEDTEEQLDALGVTIRCLPLDQPGGEGVCVLSGRPAKRMAIFARSY